MSRPLVTILCLLSALVIPAFVAAVEPSRWATYQGSADHSGLVDTSLRVPISAQPRWSKVVVPATLPGGGTYIGLAIADHRVYVTSPERLADVNPIVAVALADGATLWEHNFPGVSSVNPPAISDRGSVYLATGKGLNFGAQLHRLDGESGRLLFSVPMESQWQHYFAPTILDDRIATGGGFFSGIYAFSLSGQELYQSEGSNFDEWTPVPWRNYWLTLGETVNVIDRSNGLLQRSIAIPEFRWNGWSAGQTPVVIGDIAYFTQNNRLFAIDLDKGTVLFIRNASDFNAGDLAAQISTDGTQLFIGANARFLVVDRTGNLVNAYANTPGAGFGPTNIVTRSHVLGWSAFGLVNMFDRHDCRMVQSFRSSTERDVAAMALADGTLVVAYRDGVVAAFDIPFYQADGLFSNGFDAAPPSACSPLSGTN